MCQQGISIRKTRLLRMEIQVIIVIIRKWTIVEPTCVHSDDPTEAGSFRVLVARGISKDGVGGRLSCTRALGREARITC